MLAEFKEAYKDYALLPAENVFTSLYDVPLDDDLQSNLQDGDDSVLSAYPMGVPMEKREMELEELRNLAASSTIRQNLIVVLPRTLRYKTPYMVGKDVFALQRALSKAGFRKWGTFTTAFGAGTKKQVQNFQHSVGLTTDGIYGPTTHAKLSRYYDAYGAYLMAQVKQKLSVTPRDKVKNAAVFGYNKRAYIHYTQSSLRMYGVKHHLKPPSIPIYEDCSSFATWCYYVAGLADPNGYGYNGFGYTGTLALHGWRTYTPKVGDLALYGSGFPYSHVTIYIGNGRCISHGNEYGPLLLNVYYRTVRQFRSYTS